MNFKKYALYVGLPVLSLGIIVTVVLVLRAQNQISDVGTPIVVSSTSTSPTRSFGSIKSGTSKSEALTPAEQKIKDENTAAIKAQNPNYQETWTPEYRAYMEAQAATTTKLIETP